MINIYLDNKDLPSFECISVNQAIKDIVDRYFEDYFEDGFYPQITSITLDRCNGAVKLSNSLIDKFTQKLDSKFQQTQEDYIAEKEHIIMERMKCL